MKHYQAVNIAPLLKWNKYDNKAIVFVQRNCRRRGIKNCQGVPVCRQPFVIRHDTTELVIVV